MDTLRPRLETGQAQSQPNVYGGNALVAFFRSQWEKAKTNKRTTEDIMIKSLRQKKGEYEAEVMQAIQARGGFDGYDRYSSTKSRALLAWIHSIIFQPGERPFGVSPTPKVDLSPPEQIKIREEIVNHYIEAALLLQQQTGQPIDEAALRQVVQTAIERAETGILDAQEEQAKNTAKRMEKTVDDQFTEGGFYEALADFLEDFVDMKAGVIRGPILEPKRTLKWGQDLETQSFQPKETVEAVHSFTAVSPFDFYPVDPRKKNLRYTGIYERMRLSRKELMERADLPGYDKQTIMQIVQQSYGGGISEQLWTDAEIAKLNNLLELQVSSTDTIDVLLIHDSVPGYMLQQMGFQVENPYVEVDVVAEMVGQQIYHLRRNDLPMGEKPYAVGSYIANKGCIWGNGLLEEIADDQRAINSVFMGSVNNATMAAGPLVEENIDRLAPGEVAGQIYPMKVYKITDDMGVGQPAVRFHNVEFYAHSMMAFGDRLRNNADEHAMVPAYAHGSEDVGGAGNTATGLSMLMSAASRGARLAVKNVDKVVEKVTTFMIHINMRFNPDNTIKGDLQARGKGSTEMMIKEQLALRRKEFLQLTNNQIDLQITGLEGRRYALGETAKAMDLDASKLIPGYENNASVSPRNNQALGQFPQQQQPQQGGQPTENQQTMVGERGGGEDFQLMRQPNERMSK